MNKKISVFLFCVETIIYLLLYNLHGCTFKLYLILTFTKQYKQDVTGDLSIYMGKMQGSN